MTTIVSPITFEQRARQLVADKQYPGVTAQEVEALRAEPLDDAARLAHLETIARPRLNYLWQQAGGPIPGHELTPQELESARAHFKQIRINRQTTL